MRDIKAMLPEEIAAALAEMGQPKYRAKQIFQWLARGVTSFDEMTNLSKDLRAALSERFYISKLEMLRKQVSAIDGTIKYLWQLGDGNAVETVVMHYKHGNTICISSQVGCRQGCAFCASTIGGLIRSVESELESGVPVLKDLPLVGLLFKRSSVTKNSRELVVFVTPRIVTDDYLMRDKLSADAKELFKDGKATF